MLAEHERLVRRERAGDRVAEEALVGRRPRRQLGEVAVRARDGRRPRGVGLRPDGRRLRGRLHVERSEAADTAAGGSGDDPVATRTRDRHVSDEDPGRTDALCLRPRPLERSRPERPRHEHARTRRLHLSCVVADDEERDAHVAGRVVERAADQADALTAGMPEGVEAPTGRARRGAVRLRGRGAAAEHEHGESSRERPAHAPTLASYPLPSAKFIGFSGPATPPR